MAKAALWAETDAEARKLGERTGLDTLVVPDVYKRQDQQGKGFDPRKLLKPGRDNIVARTKELMEEFGSVNKA